MASMHALCSMQHHPPGIEMYVRHESSKSLSAFEHTTKTQNPRRLLGGGLWS